MLASNNISSLAVPFQFDKNQKNSPIPYVLYYAVCFVIVAVIYFLCVESLILVKTKLLSLIFKGGRFFFNILMGLLTTYSADDLTERLKAERGKFQAKFNSWEPVQQVDLYNYPDIFIIKKSNLINCFLF